MDFKRFLKEEGLVQIGRWLGKNLSHRSLHRLACAIAGFINIKPNSSLLKSVDTNVQIVMGPSADPKAVREMSKAIVRHLWHMQADYFYYYYHPKAGEKVLRFRPSMLEAIEDVKVRKIPTIIAGPHFGNFDLLGLSLAWQGVPMMVLSVPNPNGTYNEQNKMRNEVGMNVVPIDMRALRESRRFLLEGNCLVTGIDRPVEDPANAKYRPLFFGQPAAVPVFYTRFGLEKGVRVRVAYCLHQEDGTYMIDCSDPIPMQHYKDLKEEYEHNTERVLQFAEKAIKQKLEQWLMLYPVWAK